MNRNILCLLLLLASLPVLSAFGEEEKGLLVDWKEVYARAVDITDKVKVLPGSVLETKSYQIGKDRIPRVTFPHPVCKAEKGWNSFPGGATYPVRNYTDKKFPPNGMTIHRMQKVESRPAFNKAVFDFINSRDEPIRTYNDNLFIPFRHKGRSFLSKESHNHNWLVGKRIKWFWSDSILAFSHAYGRGYPDKGYGNEPLKDISFVTLKDGMPLQQIVYPELDGFEIIGFCYGLLDSKALVTHRLLMKRFADNSRIAYINHIGKTGCHQVHFPELNVFWGSFTKHDPTLFSTYPCLLLYDRNYGIQKGKSSVPINPMDPPSYPPDVIPKKLHGHLYVYDFESGKLKQCYRDMFYGTLVDNETVRVPHIAMDGELGYGIFRSGRFEAFLPYSTICEYELLGLDDCGPFPYSYSLCSSFLASINYGKLLIDKTSFRASIDLRAFGICGFRPFICVMSKPTSAENKQVRYIYIIGSGEDAHRRILYSIEIPEGLVKIAKPNEGYLFFNGARLYVVTGNECWSVKILEENQ